MDKQKGFLTRRILLKWWQKILLVVGCTALVALLAWVYCEYITKPVYISTVRSQLTVSDTETLLNSDTTQITRTLNITGALRDELGSVGKKGNKGLLYKNVSAEIEGQTGTLLKPGDLKDVISVTPDPSDPGMQTLLIRVLDKSGKYEDDMRALLMEVSRNQLGTLIFGEPANAVQVSVTETKGEVEDILYYRLSDEAVSSLPDKFFGKTLDLASQLKGYLKDDAFCEKIAAAAGLEAKAEDIRKRISISTTADPAVLTVNASWTDTESARRLLQDAGDECTRAVFGGTVEEWQAGLGEVTVVNENVKEWPPTLLIVGLAALVALIISYMLFSQQPLFDSLIVIGFVLFTFICVFPFYYLFINTISDNNLVAGGQINFLPQGIHFRNYERILKQEELKNALVVTVGRTILGTALMVLTSAWAGYLVTKKKMWHRSFWYRALVITMYFNAGLIPWYTNMLMLGLTGNFLAYIIPGMVAPYNIILVKTYIESIPGSLEESAIIDGASTTKVFLRIILPLSIPILATISIFGAVGNWNSFQDSLLLMSSAPNLYTLQHRLYVYLNQTTSINTEQISERMAQNLMNNGVTTKYTIAMVTIIPILLVYPFMQRYFVKGIMLGAVKG